MNRNYIHLKVYKIPGDSVILSTRKSRSSFQNLSTEILWFHQQTLHYPLCWPVFRSSMYNTVKKKWDSWISSQLTRKFQKQKFLDFYVDYNGFCLKKKWIDIIEDRESKFYSWSHHFFQFLAYLKHFNPHLSTHIPRSLTSLNFWKTESGF